MTLMELVDEMRRTLRGFTTGYSIAQQRLRAAGCSGDAWLECWRPIVEAWERGIVSDEELEPIELDEHDNVVKFPADLQGFDPSSGRYTPPGPRAEDDTPSEAAPADGPTDRAEVMTTRKVAYDWGAGRRLLLVLEKKVLPRLKSDLNLLGDSVGYVLTAGDNVDEALRRLKRLEALSASHEVEALSSPSQRGNTETA